MIVLNQHGKQAAPHGSLRNVYSLGSYNPNETYFIDVNTIDDERSGTLRMPVRSIGKRGSPTKFYFSTDLMFLAYPGYELVLPEPPLPLKVDVTKEGIGYRGGLSYDGHVVYRCPQLMPDRSSALTALAKWAEKADSKFVLPAEVVGLMKAELEGQYWTKRDKHEAKDE